MVAACSMVHKTGAAEPRESVVSDLISELAFVAARKPKKKSCIVASVQFFFIMLVWVRGCATEC